VQRLNLEGLHDLGAPELVHVARADAVRVCGVAELVRVNTNAKQTRLLVTKTLGLLGLSLYVRMLKKLPGFF
jgi:hypothetical protein